MSGACPVVAVLTFDESESTVAYAVSESTVAYAVKSLSSTNPEI